MQKASGDADSYGQEPPRLRRNLCNKCYGNQSESLLLVNRNRRRLLNGPSACFVIHSYLPGFGRNPVGVERTEEAPVGRLDSRFLGRAHAPLSRGRRICTIVRQRLWVETRTGLGPVRGSELEVTIPRPVGRTSDLGDVQPLRLSALRKPRSSCVTMSAVFCSSSTRRAERLASSSPRYRFRIARAFTGRM